MKNALGNLVSAVLCALFGIAVWVVTDRTVQGDDEGLFHADARLFPHFISVMITVISVVWLIRCIADFRAAKAASGGAEREREGIAWRPYVRVALVTVLFFVYVQLIRPLGFIAASVAAGEAALLIFREKRPLLYAVVAACVLFLYVLFQHVLKVRLP